MKNLFLFIWLIIYTCVSTGFAVSTHYCMDKQRSVKWGAAEKDVCAVCGMHKAESNGCCRDDIKVIKLQQDTQTAKLLMPSFEPDFSATRVPHYLVSPFYNFMQSSAAATFQPPPPPGDGIYLTNCVFRI